MMTPVRSLLMMASSEESTMAASCSRASIGSGGEVASSGSKAVDEAILLNAPRQGRNSV